MSERFRFSGPLLIGLISAVTIWLAASGTLALYIHPRYVIFTVVLAAVGLAFSVAAAVRGFRGEDDHEHPDHEHPDHDDPAHDPLHLDPVHLDPLHLDPRHLDPAPDAPRRRSLVGGIAAGAGALVVIAISAAMVLLPPATLSAATALQRDVTSFADAVPGGSDALDPDAGTATFTVREWAVLLGDAPDAEYFAGKQADIVGFVTPDPEDPELFYLSRFAVTCCALDAQPIGVPVRIADWNGAIRVDDWLRVQGEFAASDGGRVALEPTAWEKVDVPDQPYLF